MKIEMREDFYRGWVRVELLVIDVDEGEDDDDEGFVIATTSNTSVPVEDAAMIETKRKMLTDGVLEFVERHRTYGAPYRWGGTLDTPNLGLDCSGLVQTAFATASASKLWLPRDAYQQRAFVDPVTDAADATSGDLVFFGPSQNKVDHVAIVVAATPVLAPPCQNAKTTQTQEAGVVIRYAHCSCESTGRNGVGFDAVFVPAEREALAGQRHVSSSSSSSSGEKARNKNSEEEDRWGMSGPRPPPESAGDPVTEYYGRRFLCLGRVIRGVKRSEDVIWRVRSCS